jgi:hypothetical protein
MNKYSQKAQDVVHDTMEEYSEGKLRSGRSGKKVTSRDQAVAIGISKARSKGLKTPRQND